MTTRSPPASRRRARLLAAALALASCACGGAPADWYYHWNCHGDPDCLALNPTGQPIGTENVGPVEQECTPLLRFAAINWGPAATNSCDHDPNGDPDAGQPPPPAPTLQSVTVSPAAFSLPLGATRQLAATGHYSDGSAKDVTGQASWSIASIGPVRVDGGGLVTALAVGNGTVRATVGAFTGTASVNVGAAALQSIAVTPSSPTVGRGAVLQLTATGTWSDGSTAPLPGATWTSATPAVATVSGTGAATAVAPGTSLVTASSGGLSGSTTLTVTAPTLASIGVSPADQGVGVGFGLQYTATGVDTDGTTHDLTALAAWTSDAPGVASVDAGGLAHGLAAGTTQVTASYGGLAGSTSLTVIAATLVSIAVTPPLPTLAPGDTLHLTALGTFSDGSVLPLGTGVTWSSSLLAVATVSTIGTVTASELGTTTITASAQGKQGSTLATVTRTAVVWIVPPAPTSQPLAGVTWAGSQFVAVGAAGTVLTSPDGTAWTARGSGTAANLLGVAWTGAQAVAVGDAGTLLTSPDAVTWTARTSGAAASLAAVTWTGTQLVAVGAAGTILTSPDGVAWTARTSGTVLPLSAVAWSGTQLVAVGGVTGISLSSSAVLTSPDGAAWTARAAGFGADFGVSCAPGLVVAVGGLTDRNIVTGQRLRSTWATTSADGIAWSSAGVPGGTAFLRGVTWTGALFVAVGEQGLIVTSPDGRSWTGRSSGTAANLAAVAWSGARLVAVGDAGAVLLSP